MISNNIKNQIFMSLKTVEFDDSLGLAKVNSIIAGSLLYELMQNLIASDNSYSNKVKSTMNQYLKTYKSIVEGLRKKYVSYSLMRSLIQDREYTSFLQITESDMNQVIEYYHNKTEITPFDVDDFKSSMYNIINLSYSELLRLLQIHKNIMCPIIKYYYENYDVKSTDVEIYGINDVKGNPGKTIIFKIDNISNSKLMYDIMNSCGVSKYIYSVEPYYSYIKMIIK